MGEEQHVLETRRPRVAFPVASGIALLAAFGSTLWAYVEYALAARPSRLAIALSITCFGVGATVLLAFRSTLPFRTVQGPRPLPPAPQPPVGFGTTRRGLVGFLVAALSSIVAIVLLPLRSLGTRPQKTLRATAWRRGVRLVTTDGKPLRPDDLADGSATIIVPETAPDDPNSTAVLVRMRDSSTLRAYSRICTHAGCAVCVFLPDRSQLVCPCHHSVFDATAGGRIVSGPASQALPELPVSVDAEGRLVAGGDFDRPIGPRHG